MTVYKCQTGPAALLKDNVTELRKQKRKIMEGDFYKCEEVAFSEDVSSRLAAAALIARAASTCTSQMDFSFLLSEGQMAPAVIKLHLHGGEICNSQYWRQ